MTDYTPGPWTIDDARTRGSYPIEQFDAVSLYQRGGIDLVEEVDEANARLIAAAPDLLAALEAAYVGLRDAQTFVRGTHEAMFERLEMQAFAAIAKARGEN